MIETPESFKTLREPIMVGDLRLFGDLLPFIGFEDISIATKDLPDLEHMSIDELPENLTGTFFTIEWLGKGWSFGKFIVNG